MKVSSALKARIEDAGATVLGHPDATYAQFSRMPTRAQLDALDGVFRDHPELALRVYGYGDLDHVGYLKRLPSARHVVIDHGPIQRWEGLADLSPALTRLDVGDYARVVPLGEITRRTGLTALHLNASVSPRELPSLAKLTALTALTLRKQKLPSALAEGLFAPLASLTSLTLCSAALDSLAFLRHLPTLTELEILGSRGVTDLDTVPSLPALRALKVTLSKLTALDGISRLSGLTELGFHSSPVVSLAPLSGLTALQSLTLSMLKLATALPDFAPLTRLTSVYLGAIPGVTDLSPLRAAPALTHLRMNDAAHLTPAHFAVLAGHPTLRRADIAIGGATKNKACTAALSLPA